MSVHPDIPVDTAALAALCERWKVAELSVFGSAARGELAPDSDIDMLVTFESDAGWSLLDVAQAKLDFEALFERDTDLIERPALEQHDNPWLRHAILSEARVVYPAA